MSTGEDPQRLAAEQSARVLIDVQLTQAGWRAQDKEDLNLFAGPRDRGPRGGAEAWAWAGGLTS